MSKDLLKKQIAETRLRQEQLVRDTQEACPHLAGSLSKVQSTADIEYRRTCIAWHRLNNGIWVGICQECQKQFWPDNSDYKYWFDKQSLSIRSQAVADSSSLPHMTGTEVEERIDVQKEINSQFNAFNPRYCDGVIFTVPDLIVDSDGIRVKVNYPSDTDTHF